MAVKTNKPQLRSFWSKPKTTGEINRLPSEYVPDQTMSLREIVTRFTNGSPIPSMGKEQLFYSEDMQDLRFMDVTEKARLLFEAKASFAQLKADYDLIIKDERNADEAAKMEAYKQKIINEYIKQIQQ